MTSPNIFLFVLVLLQMNSKSRYIVNEACKHFERWNHVFHKHGKPILTEKSNNIKNTSTEFLKQRLKNREYYWIKSLIVTK